MTTRSCAELSPPSSQVILLQVFYFKLYPFSSFFIIFEFCYAKKKTDHRSRLIFDFSTVSSPSTGSKRVTNSDSRAGAQEQLRLYLSHVAVDGLPHTPQKDEVHVDSAHSRKGNNDKIGNVGAMSEMVTNGG